LSAGHLVANRKEIPLLSEDDFESSLDTVCEAVPILGGLHLQYVRI
jgi:hypothetical protein